MAVKTSVQLLKTVAAVAELAAFLTLEHQITKFLSTIRSTLLRRHSDAPTASTGSVAADQMLSSPAVAESSVQSSNHAIRHLFASCKLTVTEEKEDKKEIDYGV